MAYLKGTPNYNLPQTEDTDVRTWDDTNSAFLAIDTAIKANADSSSNLSDEITALTSRITALENNMTTAQSDISTLQTDVTTLEGKAVTNDGTGLTSAEYNKLNANL